MTKYFWMSFCDTDKPNGQQFLGVSIIPVTKEEVDRLVPLIRVMYPMSTDDWFVTATMKSWDEKCNPGGQVSATLLDGAPLPDGTPMCKLMSKAELLERHLA